LAVCIYLSAFCNIVNKVCIFSVCIIADGLSSGDHFNSSNTTAQGWYPWFAKKDITPVAMCLELLYINSTEAKCWSQLFCF